jgi:hypothetical protein
VDGVHSVGRGVRRFCLSARGSIEPTVMAYLHVDPGDCRNAGVHLATRSRVLAISLEAVGLSWWSLGTREEIKREEE